MLHFSARNLLAQFVRVEKRNKLMRNENKFTKKQKQEHERGERAK